MKGKIYLFVFCFVLLFNRCSLAESGFSFDFIMDSAKGEFDFTLKQGKESTIAALFKKKSEKEGILTVNINQWQTPFFDLSIQIKSSIKTTDEQGVRKNSENKESLDTDGMVLFGRISGQYTLSGEMPPQKLSGSFRVVGEMLNLYSFLLGDVAFGGYIGLKPPYKLNVAFDLLSMEMNDFLCFWSGGKLDYDSSGKVFGEIIASGQLDRLELKGVLESSNGFVKDLRYDSIYLNMEGVYPDIQIFNSTISETDGMSFTIEGWLNLQDGKNFKKQIKALKISPLVVSSDSDVEWTIKSLKGDAQGKRGITETRYFLRKGNKNGFLTDKETDMFGVERRIEF